MQQYLEILQQELSKADNNPTFCIQFWRMTDGRKYQSFIELLRAIHEGCNPNQPLTNNESVNRIENYLRSRFLNSKEDYCYVSHICHFHVNLEDWINCPQTCLTEIEEFIQKILKGD